jgi:hypothetical protein
MGREKKSRQMDEVTRQLKLFPYRLPTVELQRRRVSEGFQKGTVGDHHCRTDCHSTANEKFPPVTRAHGNLFSG